MAVRKPKPLIHFEMYWINPNFTIDWVVNIRIKQSSDITWSNTQGYRDKTDALRAINSLIEAMSGGNLISSLDHIKISGPGKKPC